MGKSKKQKKMKNEREIEPWRNISKNANVFFHITDSVRITQSKQTVFIKVQNLKSWPGSELELGAHHAQCHRKYLLIMVAHKLWSSS